MRLETLTRLNEARRARRAAVVVTDLATGDDRLVPETADLSADPLRVEIAAAFRSGRSRTIETEAGELFLTVEVPPPRLVVIGAVHISQALVKIARLVDFDAVVIDPRTAFATPDRFPDVPLHADWPETVLPGLALDPYTALAALTHDPKIDDVPIAEALRAGCFYVGALGSRKTHAKRRERLIAGGLSEADVEAIRAPIGLDIAASSPAEIAVAVMAEVIEALRKRPVLDGSGS